MLSNTSVVKWESRIGVIGRWIARGLGLLRRLRPWGSKILGTIKLGLLGVTKVWSVLLILTLNLLLLFQNSFLLLQEREVNENAVDEDLSLWFMRTEKMIKIEMWEKFSFPFFYLLKKTFLKIPKLCPYRKRGNVVDCANGIEKCSRRKLKQRKRWILKPITDFNWIKLIFQLLAKCSRNEHDWCNFSIFGKLPLNFSWTILLLWTIVRSIWWSNESFSPQILEIIVFVVLGRKLKF